MLTVNTEGAKFDTYDNSSTVGPITCTRERKRLVHKIQQQKRIMKNREMCTTTTFSGGEKKKEDGRLLNNISTSRSCLNTFEAQSSSVSKEVVCGIN